MLLFEDDNQSPSEPGASGEAGSTGHAGPTPKPDDKTRTSKGYFKGTKLESMEEEDRLKEAKNKEKEGPAANDKPAA